MQQGPIKIPGAKTFSHVLHGIAVSAEFKKHSSSNSLRIPANSEGGCFTCSFASACLTRFSDWALMKTDNCPFLTAKRGDSTRLARPERANLPLALHNFWYGASARKAAEHHFSKAGQVTMAQITSGRPLQKRSAIKRLRTFHSPRHDCHDLIDK